MHNPADVVALVPLTALDRAKSRLAPALSPDDRKALVLRMARHVLATCQAAPEIAEVVLLAGDDAAAAAALDGVTVRRGLDAGLAAAIADADRRHADAAATLVIPADLPDARSTDLSALCAALGTQRGIALAPTDDGGTGALLRRPPTVIAAAFGPNSAELHRRRAEAAGVTVIQRRLSGLARDIDLPGDLHRLPWPVRLRDAWAATSPRGPSR